MLLTIEYEEKMTSYVDLLILIGSLGAMMWGMMKFLLKEIHTDLSELKEDNKNSKARTDHLYQLIAEQGVRIDHLYNVCIDMLKDRR